VIVAASPHRVQHSALTVRHGRWDADTGFGILDIPAALRRPLPAVDPLEPNDDVNQVSGGGLFKDAAAALTRPGRPRASLRARVDRSEDPVDVYRVYVPARRAVRLRVVPTSNVDVELFRANAGSCYYRNRRSAAALIGGSYKPGRAVESFLLENRRAGSRYVYACVFKPRDPATRASYSLSIRTSRLGGDAGPGTRQPIG
jgi:hypothetical protein